MIELPKASRFRRIWKFQVGSPKRLIYRRLAGLPALEATASNANKVYVCTTSRRLNIEVT